MFNRKILLGSVCALVLGAASPALAGDIFGTASADYTNTHVDGFGTADTWGGNLEAATAISDTGFSAQIDGGYHKINIHGAGDGNLWNFNGSLFALVNKGGRIGATIGYNSLDGGGSTTAHVTTYGMFGEWWASEDLTAAGKIGAFDGNFIGSGYDGGARGTYYVMPDLALNGAIDYTHFGNNGDETDYTASAEYLVSEETPISIGGGYTYSNFAGIHANTYFVKLKFYCNGESGASTLVDRQRASGTLGSNVGIGSAIATYLP